MVAVSTIAAFLGNSIGVELAGAMEKPDMRFPAPVDVLSVNNSDRALTGLCLPASLGEIKKQYAGTNGKTVINIQDAHCNYSCQKNISLIFDLLNQETNVNVALLEGGAGEYDLSVFQDMKDVEIREKVADYFVKEGRMNGAEYFAVNNPGRVTLKGLEDENAYLKNLKIYRDNVRSKDKAEFILKSLSNAVSELKTDIYSPSAAAIDKTEVDYLSGSIDIKEYAARLSVFAKAIPFLREKYRNLNNFMLLVEEEKGIDFAKAEISRDEIIKATVKKISSAELEKLTANMILLKNGRMTESEFLGYIFNKANTVSIDVERAHLDLVKYAAYIKKNEEIDKDKLVFEIGDFTQELFGAVCRTEMEREIFAASRDLEILKSIFDITLTRTHYDRFISDKERFTAVYFNALITKASNASGKSVVLPQDLLDLDAYVAEMVKFYDAAFERDRYFIRKIEKSTRDTGIVIVVSGGFHSENMSRLLKEKGYSYVAVTPAFDPKEETPYFRLLSGGEVKEEKSVTEAISSIAISGMLSDFKDDPGYFYKNELMIRLREARESARPLIVNVCDKNWQLERKILFRVENGEYVREDFPAFFLRKHLVNPIRLELRVSRNNKILAMREMNGTYINDPGLDDGLSLRERGKKENHTTMPGHGNISRGDPLELYKKFLEQGNVQKLTIWQRIRIYLAVMALKRRIDRSGLASATKKFLKERTDYVFHSARFVAFNPIVLKDPNNELTANGWLLGFNTLYERSDEVGQDQKNLNGYLKEKYPDTVGLSVQILNLVQGYSPILQEYLFHEFICPSIGHENTRAIQEELFPENYADIIGDDIPGHKDGELALAIQSIISAICGITMKDLPVPERQYEADFEKFKASSFLNVGYIQNLRFYEESIKWTEYMRFAGKLGQARVFKLNRDEVKKMNEIVMEQRLYIEAKMKWLATMDPIWRTGSVLGDKNMEELSRDTQSEIRREAIEIVAAHKEFFRENPGYAFLLKDQAIIKAMAYIYDLAGDETERDVFVRDDGKPFPVEIERIGDWEQSKLWRSLMLAKDAGRELYGGGKDFTNVKWLGIVTGITIALYILSFKVPVFKVGVSLMPWAFMLCLKKGEISWRQFSHACKMSAGMLFISLSNDAITLFFNGLFLFIYVLGMFVYAFGDGAKRYLKSRIAAINANDEGVNPYGGYEDASSKYTCGLSQDILTMMTRIIEIANKSGAAPGPDARKGGNGVENIITELLGALAGEELIPSSVRSPVLYDDSEMKKAIIDKLDDMYIEDNFGDEKLSDVYNVLVNQGERRRSASDIYNALLIVARYVYDYYNESDVIDNDPKILWAIEEIVAEYFLEQGLSYFYLMCARDRISHNIMMDKKLSGRGDAKDYYALGRVKFALYDIDGVYDALKNSTSVEKDNYKYFLARGVLAHSIGNWEDAIFAYGNSVKILENKSEKSPLELLCLKLAQLLYAKSGKYVGLDGQKYHARKSRMEENADSRTMEKDPEEGDNGSPDTSETVNENKRVPHSDGSEMPAADEKNKTSTDKGTLDRKYLEDAGMKMFKELTASSCLKHPCVIGVVVKARPEDKVDEVLARDFVKVVESLGAKIEKKTLLAKGIAEYQTENVKYVVYVDDGTANGENISRLKEFKGVLEKNGASGSTMFSWVLNEKSRAGNNEYSSCLGSLSEISYLMGLEGDYCPVSWQIIVAPLIVNLIDSKNELEQNTGADAGWRKVQEERIDAIVKSIVNCVKLMTDENYGAFIKEVGGDLADVLLHMTIKDLRRFMNGSLALPLATKSSVAIEEYRKMDTKVLRSV
ncbi:MAG TPA: hypothetical protein PKY78_01445 [Candidatus Omnitrophota bacterium]|nr:hypothetical protein [Candidatus Omnitrophota bacterium]